MSKTTSNPHKKWFKILFNPMLRKFGYSIVSVFENDILLRYELKEYPKYCAVIKKLKS